MQCINKSKNKGFAHKLILTFVFIKTDKKRRKKKEKIIIVIVNYINKSEKGKKDKLVKKRKENPQIMEKKCGEPLDIADERERGMENPNAQRETQRQQSQSLLCFTLSLAYDQLN